MDSINGKVALVTGASSGIGASTAKLFAKYGAKLALTGRNKENLEKVADQCVANGVDRKHIIVVTADLSKEAEVSRLWQETAQYFQRLDILVNNAGFGIIGSVGKAKLSQLEAMMKVNVHAMLLLSQMATPFLVASEGVIVNVTSVASSRVSIGTGAYGMSKAAVNMLTKSLAMELGPLGVRVNAICPGSVDTPMLRDPRLPKEKTDKFMDILAKRHVLQRYAHPDDIAPAIVFLASDAASFITGAVIPVDGGLHITSAWFKTEVESTLRRAAKNKL